MPLQPERICKDTKVDNEICTPHGAKPRQEQSREQIKFIYLFIYNIRIYNLKEKNDHTEWSKQSIRTVI